MRVAGLALPACSVMFPPEITAAGSGLLAQKQLVAMEILELHARAPWTGLRFAEKLHTERHHPLVVGHAVRRVEGQERVTMASLFMASV